MANAKKYLEVFNGGQDDLYIRDQEAHEELDNIPSIYATKQELQEAQVASMLHIYVDKATMHLKGTPTSEGTFSVRNGHLILTPNE